MARRNYYFKSREEYERTFPRIAQGFADAVDKRKQMSPSVLLGVLEDRNKRLYRAMLINKVGAVGYHIMHAEMLKHFRKQFDDMVALKPLWDDYRANMEKGVLREHYLRDFPKVRELEIMVENWIWWAEFTMDIQKDGQEHRWTIEALEFASKIVDTGCFKVEGNVVTMVKTPNIKGWESVLKH